MNANIPTSDAIPETGSSSTPEIRCPPIAPDETAFVRAEYGT